jgi:hypothetical protein
MVVSMTAFLLTQDELGLYSVSAVFGLAFGGLIPGYILAIRKIFPTAEASWRIPAVLFPGAPGMAAGGWLAGVIHDGYGFYAPAFNAGIAINADDRAVGQAGHADIHAFPPCFEQGDRSLLDPVRTRKPFWRPTS